MSGIIELAEDQLLLDGVPSVVLCSSVFPFRIPRSQWDHRLQLVQESGYGMIDVYVHWGFHEQVPGQIDLESPQRDLRHFLALAKARGLTVMARPGPYICSETDGGGLPWWLHGDRPGAAAALRTTDPDYLAAVDRWFGAVMPVLADAQVTRGGAVALVQIENELDFFDCPDPDAYIAHLADSARAHGIEVPLIACAGQGDLAGASGDAVGVVPTVNLYPDDTSVTFDQEARYYAGVLGDRGLPLMVTETNRIHRTLRREILAGARLVAPYLQTSGFDHLVLPSAGNWGTPGNLMTHDYDFGGYLSPDGRRRPEYDEAIALAATLEAWGERLATATPAPLTDVRVDGAAAGGALALAGGGHLVGPAELDGLERVITLRDATGRESVEALLAPGTCPFWALDVPLEPWGSEGTLVLATAELAGLERPGDGGSGPLVLTFDGGQEAQIVLELPATDGGLEHLRLVGPGTIRSARAVREVQIVLRERSASRADPEPVLRRTDGEVLAVAEAMRELGSPLEVPSAPILPGAEALGAADGRLRAELDLSSEAREVLLLGAADLVRLELDGVDHGVQVAHGAPLSLPLAAGLPHHLTVTSEIWGRANFDDARRPALRLGAGRGIGRVLEVHDSEDVTALWEVRRLPDRRERGPVASPALRDLGGWSSANPGQEVHYARELHLPGPGMCGVLRLHGLAHPVHVSVDGGPERLVMPAAPVIELDAAGGEAVAAGAVAVVEIRAPHVPGGLLDGAELLAAAPARVSAVRLQSEGQIASGLTAVARAAGGEAWRMLPAVGLRVGAGSPALIRLSPPGVDPAGELRGWLLELAGCDVEITVIAGGHRVSRHVLGRPDTAGGNPRRSWIPAGWAGDEDPEVLLLVEALREGGGIFEGVTSARTVR